MRTFLTKHVISHLLFASSNRLFLLFAICCALQTVIQTDVQAQTPDIGFYFKESGDDYEITGTVTTWDRLRESDLWVGELTGFTIKRFDRFEDAVLSNNRGFHAAEGRWINFVSPTFHQSSGNPLIIKLPAQLQRHILRFSFKKHI